MTVETEVARHYTLSAVIVLGLALFGITAGSTARAAEIKLLSASALHPAIDALIPDFEKSSGHKVTVAYGTAGAVADRVQNGEAADIVISSVTMIDRLQAQGKVVAGDRVAIAKVGVGAFVRNGAAKPDISSVDAFKRSMPSRFHAGRPPYFDEQMMPVLREPHLHRKGRWSSGVSPLPSSTSFCRSASA